MIVSAPSYIMRGTYLENVRRIAELPGINSVELLFFLYDEDTDNLIRREIGGIKEYAGPLGFTVHMPDELREDHREIIELTADIARHYVIHPPSRDEEGFLTLISDWIDDYGEKFMLENLIERGFDELLAALPRFGICFDTGHLLMRGEVPAEFTETYGRRVREVHLHGVSEGWDHSVFPADEPWFQGIIPFLREFTGVCNIEVFEEAGVLGVLKNLEEEIPK